MVPQIDPNFHPFGCFATLLKVIDKKVFFPMFITGPTGSGKTLMVEQACARAGRDFVRINITTETDEDALMGGWRLIDGNTVFREGPVLTAMRSGSVLLFDEIDLAHPARIMCLQSVLEGKGYHVKKTNEYVLPESGFQIVATANTKGIGDETGSYIGTSVLNEAFLERFAVMEYHGYPSVEEEGEILARVMDSLKLENENFVETLLNFADKVRKEVATSDEFRYSISTRRLVHIVNAYNIFNDEDYAVKVCLNRFDEYHAKAFFNFYKMLKPEAMPSLEPIYPNTDTHQSSAVLNTATATAQQQVGDHTKTSVVQVTAPFTTFSSSEFGNYKEI